MRVLAAFGLIGTLIVGAGCNTVRHSVDFSPEYKPKPGTKLSVAGFSDATAEVHYLKIEQMLGDAFLTGLRERALLATLPGDTTLAVSGAILDYEPGNAFKRWLWPGWGPTLLLIRYSLADGTKEVATGSAKRRIAAGPFGCPEAWKRIFAQVAGDAVSDIALELGLANQE